MKVYVLKYSTVGWVIALFIFIIAFWGVRYNSDWEGYSYFYTHSDQSPDIAFGMLSDIFVEIGRASCRERVSDVV